MTKARTSKALFARCLKNFVRPAIFVYLMHVENFSRRKFCITSEQKYARRTKFVYATYKQGGPKHLIFANEVFAALDFHIYRFAGYEQNKDRHEKTKCK